MASPSARVATVALTCVPAFMVVLDNLVVVPALAAIRRDLDVSVEQLSWTVNAYVLSFGVLMLTGAVLGDRLGRRRMFVAGLVVFSGASAAAALALSAGALIAARAVQGVGAALIMPLSLALVSDAFPPHRRGAAIGAWSALIGTAVALRPARRRSDHRRARVAVDLLDQRADRPGGGRSLRPLDAGDVRRHPATRRARARARERRTARDRLGCRSRQRRRLGERRDARPGPRGPAAARRLRALAADGSGPDAAARPVRKPPLHGGQRGLVPDGERALRRRLRRAAVPAGGARALGAPGRPADAALDAP
jgi:hypothetical protein